MISEKTLLDEFAAKRSEEAFAGIVQLHLKLVFSTALRQLGDRALAEEVTQSVFLVLAEKAASLNWDTTLAGWLYRTTLNQARQRLRTELRRQRREEVAAAMAECAREGESVFAAVVPLLDEALLGLREKDRLALMLHYLEERPLREVGKALGVGEDAARKRVHRTLSDLTEWFRKRGFAVTSAGLLSAFSAGQAAPASLAASISAAAVAAPIGAPALVTTVIYMTSTKKLAVAAALALALGIGIGTPLLLRQSEAPAGLPEANPPNVAARQTDVSPVVPQTVSAVESLPSSKSPEPAVVPPAKSFFERVNDGDMSLSMLPREKAEEYLVRNKTNAQSLIGAYRVTHDLDYLRTAAKLHPTVPAVLMRVVAHDAFPEDRRNWIEHYKQADKENSLPFYLSAAEHLKKNEFEAAIGELEQAGGKKQFQDYVTEHMLTLEEMYLSAGHSAAEAKMLGMAAVELPYLSQMAEMSNTLIEQVKGYALAGDQTGVENVAKAGLQLAQTFNSIQDGGNLLGEMVSAVMEQRLLKQLDPNGHYAFMNGSVPERLAAATAREKEIRESAQFFGEWVKSAPEPEIISYFDRLKLYGEAGALEWLKERSEPAPP